MSEEIERIELTSEDRLVLKLRYGIDLVIEDIEHKKWVGCINRKGLPLEFLRQHNLQTYPEADLYWRTIESRNKFLKSLIEYDGPP